MYVPYALLQRRDLPLFSLTKKLLNNGMRACHWTALALDSPTHCMVFVAAVTDQIDKHQKKIRDLKNQLEELKVRSSMVEFIYLHVFIFQVMCTHTLFIRELAALVLLVEVISNVRLISTL